MRRTRPRCCELGQEYGADKDRFEKEASFCILCGLCVRYCAEVKQTNAVGFVDRGARREISFIPEIAARGVLGLQGVLPALPDVGAAGGLRAGRGARLRSRVPRGRIGLLVSGAIDSIAAIRLERGQATSDSES